MSISLTEDIKTVEDLEAAPRALLEQAQRTGRPVVIAEGGKPAVVLLTAERYEWLVHLVNFARLINEGEESIRKEGTIPLEDFIRDMEAKHGYKVSRRAKPRARADAEAIHDAIAQARPQAAEKWWREFSAKLRRLRTMPLMYEVVPEVELAGADFRHFEHKGQRIIYRVSGRRVVVVRVIAAGRRLTPEMLLG